MDYNFYEPIKKPKKQSNLANLLLVIFIILALGIPGFLTVEQYFKREDAQQQYTQAELRLNDANLRQQVTYLEELEAAVYSARVKEQFVDLAGGQIENSHYVNSTVLSALEICKNNALTIYFESLTIADGNFALNGTAGSIVEAAMLESNLRNYRLYDENLFVNLSFTVITLDSGSFVEYNRDNPNRSNIYGFTASFTLPSAEPIDPEELQAVLEGKTLENAPEAVGDGEEQAEGEE